MAPVRPTARPRTRVPGQAPADLPAARAAQETFLYRLASFPVRLWRKYFHPPQPPTESDEFYGGAKVLNGQEIKDALAGEYGAVTRVTAGQQSLTLYSAIPVPNEGKVGGAVLVSQSTFRMLSDLYVLRLDIFRLFLWSVATAIVLSLLVSATITIPIRRLRDQAHAILDPRGRLLGGIVASRARDEVGELSRSLGELTARLKHRVGQMESFASDVSHEFKNPLASIRSAAEIANSSRDPEERRTMLSMVLEDVSRMERLLTGVREISRIDSGSVDGEENAAVDVKEIAQRVVSAARRRSNGSSVTFTVDGDGAAAWLPPGRLEQVVENLVDNAAGFSPPGGVVRVSIATTDGFAILRVRDQGPGIPPEHTERIFDRFFQLPPAGKEGRTRRPRSFHREGDSRESWWNGGGEHPARRRGILRSAASLARRPLRGGLVPQCRIEAPGCLLKLQEKTPANGGFSEAVPQPVEIQLPHLACAQADLVLCPPPFAEKVRAEERGIVRRERDGHTGFEKLAQRMIAHRRIDPEAHIAAEGDIAADAALGKQLHDRRILCRPHAVLDAPRPQLDDCLAHVLGPAGFPRVRDRLVAGLPRPLEQGDKRAPRQACFGTPEPQGRHERIRFLLEKVDGPGSALVRGLPRGCP